MNTLHLFLIQAGLIWENPAANRAHFEKLIRSCQENSLILLPEMFSSGFSMNPQRVAEPPGGETWQWLSGLAIEKKSFVGGSYVVTEDGRYFNRFVLASPEGERMQYDKRHLFTMAGEEKTYSRGNEKKVVSIFGWRVLLQVCYDLRFPVFSRSVAGSTEEYDLAVYVANWPETRISHWKTLLASRAIENQAFVAGLNRSGTDGNGLVYPGASQVIAASGEMIAEALKPEEIVSAKLDINLLLQYRSKFPFLKDGDFFSLGKRD